MAFPTTSVLDNFTGTDGTDLPVYSANWAQSNTNWPNLEIQANAATGTVSSAVQADHWTAATFGPDSEAFVTITTKPSAGSWDFVQVMARLQGVGGADTVDGYDCYMNVAAGTDVAGIERIDNGVFTLLGAEASQEWAAGDALGLEIIGTTSNIKMYRKPSGGSWAQLGSTQSDSTYQNAGSIGIMVGNTTGRSDDFGGGTIVVGDAFNPVLFNPFSRRGIIGIGERTH